MHQGDLLTPLWARERALGRKLSAVAITFVISAENCSHEELDTHHKRLGTHKQTVNAPCGRGPISRCRASRPRCAAEPSF